MSLDSYTVYVVISKLVDLMLMGLTLGGRIAVTGVQPFCYPVYYLYTIYSLYKSVKLVGFIVSPNSFQLRYKKRSLSSATRMFQREIHSRCWRIPNSLIIY